MTRQTLKEARYQGIETEAVDMMGLIDKTKLAEMAGLLVVTGLTAIACVKAIKTAGRLARSLNND